MKTPLESCKWFPFSDEPLVTPKRYVPRFSDPQILLPEESCDGRWHMFFHSWIGIHHFTSDSGIAWNPDHVIAIRAHSPFIYMEGDYYYLVYEKHDRKIPFIDDSPADTKNDANSRIEVIVSTDLTTWSKPRLLLEAKNVPFAGDYIPVHRVSRPQLLKVGTEYRLYFGASHLRLPDTNKRVSRYFSYAVSQNLMGPYTLADEKPLIESEPDDKWTNLGVGSIRLIQYDGKIYAFRCGMYWDQTEKKTKSALMILSSEDGRKFSLVTKAPIMVPSQKGWASSYIMGCDVRYRQEEKCWYCYYSAVGSVENIVKGESIGLLLGSPGTKAKLEEPQDRVIFLT